MANQGQPRPGIKPAPAKPTAPTLTASPSAQAHLIDPSTKPRPGAANLKPANHGGSLVTDGTLNTQVKSLLPSVLQSAPPGFHMGPHGGGVSGTASEAWLTAAMKARGVPLQDGQRVTVSGQVVEDPGWWQKWGKSVALIAATGLASWGLAGGIKRAPDLSTQPGGLLGFEGEGSVIGGVPAALPRPVVAATDGYSVANDPANEPSPLLRHASPNMVVTRPDQTLGDMYS